jgi:hypothetical protein
MNLTANGSHGNGERMFRGGAIFVVQFYRIVSTIAYEYIAFGDIPFTDLVHRPVLKIKHFISGT